ncbi:MAG: hypothetical protein ACYDCO_18035 [Armatimonadota bacterium]
MGRNLLFAWQQGKPGLSGWLGLGFCLCLLLGAANRGACWGGDTTIGLTLYETPIFRDAWEAAYGRYMFGAITVSQPGNEAENKVKLQGHRSGTLWDYEDYWTMNTVYLLFTSSQTGAQYEFPMGPPCIQPDDLLQWEQFYTYSATIWAGFQYISSSDILDVVNEMFGGDSIIEEETL